MIRDKTGNVSDGILMQIIKMESIRSLIIMLLLLILGLILLPESDIHKQSRLIDSFDNSCLHCPAFLRGHSKCVTNLWAITHDQVLIYL